MRGWRCWFATGASGYLLGPYGSATDAQAALAEDFDAVEAGIFDRAEAADQVPLLGASTAPDAYPDAADCIEDFDGDAMWGVWSIKLQSDAQLYFVGTPDGPLADLFYDRRRCRLAAIAAKANHDASKCE